MCMERDSFLLHRELTAHIFAAAGLTKQQVGRRVANVYRQICVGLAPTVSLEIGAYEAGFSKWIKQRVPSLRALAFEANPHVYERFKDAVKAEGVEYVHACANDSAGPVTIRIPREFRGVSRAADNQMASVMQNTEAGDSIAVEVRGVKVDDYVHFGDDDRIVAWIDVEGACKPVLTGSRRILSKTSCVFIELESREMWKGQWLDTDVAEFMGELGYVPVLRDIARGWQFNYVFLKPAVALSKPVLKQLARVFEPPPSGEANAKSAEGAPG